MDLIRGPDTPVPGHRAGRQLSLRRRGADNALSPGGGRGRRGGMADPDAPTALHLPGARHARNLERKAQSAAFRSPAGRLRRARSVSVGGCQAPSAW